MNDVVKLKPKQKLSEKFAAKYSMESDFMLHTLKQTAFRQRDGAVTNEQMVALMIVADQHGLNPFTKEIYAFPDKSNGIVPVVGVDGWMRIINDHKQFNGLEFEQSDEIVNNKDAKPCPAWMECIIYRKDRDRPIRVREYLDEVYQGKRGNFSGPWQTHTKRMLRHKTLIQAARIAFSFSGIYDEDEAERIIESGEIDITPKDTIVVAELPEEELSDDEAISTEQAQMIADLMETKGASGDDLKQNFDIADPNAISRGQFPHVLEWLQGF